MEPQDNQVTESTSGGGGSGEPGKEPSILSGVAGQQTNSEAPSGAEPGQQQQARSSAPESYEPFVIPEDATNVVANEEVMTGFSDLARELNLTQEQAQKVYEYGAKTMHKAIGDGMDALRAQMEEIKSKWHREASEDPVVKTDLNHAKRVVDRFGNDEVKKFFDETGIGSNKTMIHFLIEVGKAIGEAPLHVQGAGVAAGGADIGNPYAVANSMYANKM